MKCKFCKKEIDETMEVEYSEHYSEIFCCPDHAMSYYFEMAGSRPLEKEEIREILNKEKNNENNKTY